VAQLEQQLKQVTQGGTRSAPSSSKKSDSRRSRGRHSAGQNSDAAAAGANKPSPQMHPCTFCYELGHWHKECPVRKNRPKEEAGVQPVLTVSAKMSPTKIYVTIIDFPNLGSTYNGWCTATETDETLISRPSCEVNVK